MFSVLFAVQSFTCSSHRSLLRSIRLTPAGPNHTWSSMGQSACAISTSDRIIWKLLHCSLLSDSRCDFGGSGHSKSFGQWFLFSELIRLFAIVSESLTMIFTFPQNYDRCWHRTTRCTQCSPFPQCQNYCTEICHWNVDKCLQPLLGCN